jgi:hypothetical protein
MRMFLTVVTGPAAVVTSTTAKAGISFLTLANVISREKEG